MPTRKTIYWLLAAASLYLIAWNVGSGWLYVLTTLLLAFPLVSIPLSRLNSQKIEINMMAPPSVTSGERLPVVMEIRNLSRLPRFFLDLDCEYAGSRLRLFVSSLGPHESREIILEFDGVRRGSYTGALVRLSSAAPAGLARSRRQLDAPGPLVVYPAWHRLTTDWDSGQKNAGYMVSSAVPTRHTASDYLGVREYRSGDSPRSIHWRSSARTGKLTSIEYSRQAAITPVLLLDTFSEAGQGDPESPFETSVTIAASLAQREASHNRRLGIGSFPGDAGARGLGASLEESMLWLAQVDPTAPQPMDLAGDDLPWPEATPVLLLTSHQAYARLDQSDFLQEFPHSIVIMLDGRGFQKSSGRQGSRLMDTRSLDSLADRLESRGAEFLLIASREEVPACLANL